MASSGGAEHGQVGADVWHHHGLAEDVGSFQMAPLGSRVYVGAGRPRGGPLRVPGCSQVAHWMPPAGMVSSVVCRRKVCTARPITKRSPAASATSPVLVLLAEKPSA